MFTDHFLIIDLCPRSDRYVVITYSLMSIIQAPTNHSAFLHIQHIQHIQHSFIFSIFSIY